MATGSEGRTSYLKRRWGWDRSLLDGLGGAATWCGLGVLAHNSIKIAALIYADGTRPAVPASGRPDNCPRSLRCRYETADLDQS